MLSMKEWREQHHALCRRSWWCCRLPWIFANAFLVSWIHCRQTHKPVSKLTGFATLGKAKQVDPSYKRTILIRNKLDKCLLICCEALLWSSCSSWAWKSCRLGGQSGTMATWPLKMWTNGSELGAFCFYHHWMWMVGVEGNETLDQKCFPQDYYNYTIDNDYILYCSTDSISWASLFQQGGNHEHLSCSDLRLEGFGDLPTHLARFAVSLQGILAAKSFLELSRQESPQCCCCCCCWTDNQWARLLWIKICI